ncbi:ATP-binding protein [Actinokineospora iranica]|uniref:ATP-binding protein n=1 Tax=Actinokineospora iranica TaxID=1271860 RepID=UPI0011139FD3|nr:ATP-binding protein [Actinokineospora iranica]
MSEDMRAAADVGRVRELSTRLPRSTRAAGQAREFAGSALRSWGVPEDLVCDVVLATSELVTNAVEHGAGRITVALSVSADRVLLRVRDETSDAPVRRPSHLLSERSRGLTIVAALSRAWGHQPDPEGKWVWAEFALAPSADADETRPSAATRGEFDLAN